MKSVLNWLKDNPILIVAAILGVVSLVLLMKVAVDVGQFRSEVAKRESVARSLNSMASRSVTLPPQQLHGQPESVNISINPAAIEHLRTIYGEMSQDFGELREVVIQTNRGRHGIMLEDIFPDPGERINLLYQADDRYREAFESMFGPYTPSSLYPRLNAKPGPPQQGIQEELDRVQMNFLNSMFVERMNDLKPDQHKELEQRLADAKLEFLMRWAEGAHIYANDNRQSSDYPFDVGGWAFEVGRPDLAAVWRGQMGLWIQQDIVEAIARANRVEDRKYNVMVSPIKRLLSIRVGEGAVGIETTGMVSNAGELSADGKMREDFAISPTGRVSNNKYDVWHVRVRLIADVARLNEFIDTLSETNFMTVLEMDLQDVDEYQALSEGYVYGNGDAVQVDMVIETIWLRDWTEPLMPQEIKVDLGLIKGERRDQTGPRGRGGAGPPGMGGRGGGPPARGGRP